MIPNVWGASTLVAVRLIAASVVSVGMGVVLFLRGYPGGGVAMIASAGGPAFVLWVYIRQTRAADQTPPAH